MNTTETSYRTRLAVFLSTIFFAVFYSVPTAMAIGGTGDGNGGGGLPPIDPINTRTEGTKALGTGGWLQPIQQTIRGLVVPALIALVVIFLVSKLFSGKGGGMGGGNNRPGALFGKLGILLLLANLAVVFFLFDFVAKIVSGLIKNAPIWSGL